MRTQTSCQPYEWPSSIKLQHKVEGTNPLLTTSITLELRITSENSPYNYLLRIALDYLTENELHPRQLSGISSQRINIHDILNDYDP